MANQLNFDINVNSAQAVQSINTFFDAFENGAKNSKAFLDKALGEKVEKEITVEFKGGQLVATEVEKITKKTDNLAKAANVVKGNFGKTPDEIKRSINILKELIGKTHKYKDGTKFVTDEWKALVQLLRDARKEAKEVKIADGLEKSITNANIAAGLALDAIRGLTNAVKNLITQGIGMEVLMIQLRGFTGSTEEARDVYKEFIRIAQATPFNVKQVADASRTMMGFGVSTGRSVELIDQLAIVAAATGGELGHMARNVGQISANQRAYTRDLMQFANQGIPIYQTLADVMGTTTQKVREMAEDGKIGFGEVAEALRELTKEGSAYRNIAEDMDKTIQARLEALGSAITTTAGKMIENFQKVDQAFGGPFEKTIKFAIDTVNKLGDAFDWVGDNVNNLMPLILALVGALTVGSVFAVVMNFEALVGVFTILATKVLSLTAVKAALNVQLAIMNALLNNWGAVAAVAAMGALAGVALQNANNMKALTKDTDAFNTALKNEIPNIDASTNATKLLAFQTKNLTSARRDDIKEKRDEFEVLQGLLSQELFNISRTMGYLEEKAGKQQEIHKKEIENLNEKLEAEKTAHEQVMSMKKRQHDDNIENLNDELSKIREKYDMELGKLDEESEFAKELRKIKKEELEDKLKSSGLTREETLRIKEQLLQMDRTVKRRELMADKQKDEKRLQNEINEAQKKHKDEMQKITDQYNARIKEIENAKKTEEDAIKAIDDKMKEYNDRVKKAKGEELSAIYDNEEAALDALDSQIRRAEDLRLKMMDVYEAAKLANIEARRIPGGTGGTPPERAAGGPVTGGSTYTVNELGKEAFLSAAGRLSMINAPAWGTWRAPSSGTVIPAHLTEQLDVPSGGINLNSRAGSAAMKGGMNGVVRAIGAIAGRRGDQFNNTVTIQSANPRQTASDVLVKLHHLRGSRRR